MPTTIHCTVVETRESRTNTEQTYEAYDLLPWADPYIASLINSLERSEYPPRQNQLEKSGQDPLVSPRETQHLNSTKTEGNTAHRFMSL